MIKTLKERLQFARFCILHRRSLATQRRWQERHLRHLVAHAREHVPLWRELLRERSIAPDGIHTLDDLPKLPVTSKQTYIGRMTEEYVDNSRMLHRAWHVTSGTSGTPFRFLMSERFLQKKYADFASFRFLWWRGEPIRTLSSLKRAWIRVRGRTDRHSLFVSLRDFFDDPRQALAQIEVFKADTLGAYPSILLEIAQMLSKNPSLPRPKLRFALSFGEMLFPSVRSFVADTLGCELYDRYGLEEIGVVGLECAMHDGFHINTESVIVEITDDSYTPVPVGKEGRVVATSLWNYGMPFIRYDTEDRGKISYEPCACGLRSPRIWIKGRYSLSLSFPARVIHHLEFDAAMDGFMHTILQYQIAKRSDSEIVVRIVPGPAFRPAIVEQVKNGLSRLVGSTVRVHIETVERIPRTPRGKCRIVIDESSTPLTSWKFNAS